MHTYIADFEYEDNGRGTMGAQSYMFEADTIQAAAAIAEAFRAALSRVEDYDCATVKTIVLTAQACSRAV